MSEKVTYRGKTYTVSRYVDKEDEKLLTPQKQKIAKLYFYKGMSSSEISQILNVDETLLQVWYEGEMKRENISEAAKRFNEGKSKRVIATNTNTGEEREYNSLSACARDIGCVASTVLYKIKNNKKYKQWKFSYKEDWGITP